MKEEEEIRSKPQRAISIRCRIQPSAIHLSMYKLCSMMMVKIRELVTREILLRHSLTDCICSLQEIIYTHTELYDHNNSTRGELASHYFTRSKSDWMRVDD